MSWSCGLPATSSAAIGDGILPNLVWGRPFWRGFPGVRRFRKEVSARLAHDAFGNTVEGISWIEDGIRDYRATGAIIGLPFLLGMKAEALHLADRTSEALEAIKEAEALVERYEERRLFPELHRLRGVFLTAMGADETQIEASFGEAIRIAREQKSISLEKRAEGSYGEYRRHKATGAGRDAIRLPLCS